MQVLSVYVNEALSERGRGKVQYSTASTRALVSASMPSLGEITSSTLFAAIAIGCLSDSGSAVPFFFCCRDMIFPGGSHLNLAGLTSPYPGHWLPDLEHLLHAGRVESHTTRRRRHSQQWRFRFSSIFGIVPEEFNAWLVGNLETNFVHKQTSNGKESS